MGCGSAEYTALRPRLVEDLQSKRVVDIACGDSHVIALTHGKVNHTIHCTSLMGPKINRISIISTGIYVG